MAEQFTIDSTLIDAANTQIVLDDGVNGTRLISHDYPDPGQSYMGTSSADTEGSVRVQNQAQDRTISAVARCYGASMRTRVKQLQQKAGKLNREGGVVTRTLTDGTVIHFDVLSAKCVVPANWEFANRTDVMVSMEFVCRPLGYGAEQTIALQTETALPCNIYTVTGVKGDVPALGRLVVTEAQGADQAVVRWGLESRFYGGTSSAYALFMEAESRLLYSGVAGTAVSGASGGSIVAGTATTSYQALCSTTTSGTVYGAHVGTYRVRGRVYCPANAGTVSYALQWGVGDLRSFTVNDAATYDPLSAATFRDVDLGLVYLPKVAKGAQRWEGRVLAASTTVGDRVGVDALYLYPAGEGSGEASAVVQYQQPTAFSGRDEFAQTSGTLGGKTAPIGGTWATSGATTDFSVTGAGSVTRSTSSDSGTGRYAILGSTTLTDVAVQIDYYVNKTTFSPGVVARYVDASNFLVAYVLNTTMYVSKFIAGTETVLASTSAPGAEKTHRTLRLQVDSAGRFAVYLYLTGSDPGSAALTGQSSVLATGGTLATGKTGFRDANATGTASARIYDNFQTFVPVFDAAVFSNQQLEIRSDQAIRLDGSGTVWSPVSKYEGNYLKVPPAGAEGRSARFIVKGHRNDPTTGADSAIDDLTVQLFYVPRWSTVPEP